MSRNRLVLFLIAIFALAVFVGCGSSDDSSDESSTSGDATTTASSCTPADLNTFKDGVLTIGTDSPAYPPYFEDDDPTNGKGFESALGYAIASELGFNDSQVEWTTYTLSLHDALPMIGRASCRERVYVVHSTWESLKPSSLAIA